MPAHVNLHFGCTVDGCNCGDVVVAAQVVIRGDGMLVYDHTNRCPKCHHRLGQHRMTEQPVTPQRVRKPL